MARVQYFGKTTASTSVTVYWAGTTTKPTIYGSATGSSISNPLTSTFEGDYSFWVDEGHYKILNGKLVNGVATNIDDAYILSTQGAEPTASKSSLAPFQTNTATDVEEWVEGAYTGSTYVAASALKSATTVVGVAAATAPSSGQVLTATSSTTATWQTPASGTPPGADTQVIFNDGGAYGADADLTYNKTTNTLTTTTFVGALTGNASTATTATNATNTGITDDTTTNATMYPTWVTAATGNLPQKVSSTKFTFNPSTGKITATSGTFGNLNVVNDSISSNTASTSFEVRGAGAALPCFKFNDNANFSNSTSSTVGVIDFPTAAGPVNYTATSGNQDMFRITKTFAPTSGSATFGMMRLTPTINQTGGANGISRGLYVDATLTSSSDYRAIDTVGGYILNTQDVAASSTDGIVLATSATATSGNQKLSPSVRMRGSVWSVTAAAAKTTDWKMEVEPIQGNTGASTLLVSHSLAGAAYVPMFEFRSEADWVNAFVVVGTTNGITYATTKGNADAHTYQRYDDYTGVGLSSGGTFRWSASSTSGASPDTFLARGGAAANIQMGAAAANPPVAQTLSVQDASGTDIAGATWTLRGSRGTGTGTPGSIAFQTSTALGTGTTLQTATTRLTISSTAVTSTLPVVVPGYTVANLPTGVTGMRAYVTDANATTFLSTVAGGGSNTVPVFYNGTNWVIG